MQLEIDPAKPVLTRPRFSCQVTGQLDTSLFHTAVVCLTTAKYGTKFAGLGKDPHLVYEVLHGSGIVCCCLELSTGMT